MTIRIRPFEPSDRDFILSLAARFSEFELPAWRVPRDLDETNRRLLQEALDQPDPDAAIFIAEEDGTRVGFVHLQTRTDYFSGEKYGYLSDLAVEKAFEGRGIGQRLLAVSEAWARSKGYRLLTLEVFADNQGARQLYEKDGFSPEVVKYVKVIG